MSYNFPNIGLYNIDSIDVVRCKKFNGLREYFNGSECLIRYIIHDGVHQIMMRKNRSFKENFQ